MHSVCVLNVPTHSCNLKEIDIVVGSSAHHHLLYVSGIIRLVGKYVDYFNIKPTFSSFGYCEDYVL